MIIACSDFLLEAAHLGILLLALVNGVALAYLLLLASRN